jgi:hypothetical protein
MKRLISICALTLTAAPAFAGDIYAAIGVPGLMVGYSQPVTDNIALRADIATVGHQHYSYSNTGIDYDGALKADRIGLFADLFIYGGFRITGGATFSNTQYSATGHGNGSTITIGGQPYAATAADGVIATVKFPRTMPYLGVGYSAAPNAGPGWGFMFDAGLSFGKPSVTGQVTGPLAGNVPQSDIDRELQDVRGNVDKFKGIPQLTVGVTYRF